MTDIPIAVVRGRAESHLRAAEKDLRDAETGHEVERRLAGARDEALRAQTLLALLDHDAEALRRRVESVLRDIARARVG